MGLAQTVLSRPRVHGYCAVRSGQRRAREKDQQANGAAADLRPGPRVGALLFALVVMMRGPRSLSTVLAVPKWYSDDEWSIFFLFPLLLDHMDTAQRLGPT